MEEQELYDTIGEHGFRRLVSAFYRQIPSDDLLGPMYRTGLEGAEGRLRDFLIFRFGGPQKYVEERGHPRLRMRHAPFPVGEAARNRWVQLMDAALREADIPEPAAELLRRYFSETATFLINRSGS